MGKQKIVISERALYQRVARKLKQQGHALRTSRTPRMELDCGHYYSVNIQYNVMGYKGIDLEAMGRELEVLAPWSALDK